MFASLLPEFNITGSSPLLPRNHLGDQAGWSASMPPLELTFSAKDAIQQAAFTKAVEAVIKSLSAEGTCSLRWESGQPGQLKASFHDILRVADELSYESHPGPALAKALKNALPFVPVAKGIPTLKGELPLDGPPLLMGILNITPDSFSDGGQYLDPVAALDRAWKLVEEGADILDLGAESTRPGSDPVPAGEELRRLLPVLRKLGPKCPVPISVDTYKAKVAEVALGEGASLINDISGLTLEPSLAEVVARYKAPIILMHILGRPKTMQEAPRYRWLMADVVESLSGSVARAYDAGIPLEKCLIDPGLGFGKTFAHNEELIEGIPVLRRIGQPVVVGPSRKAFIRAKWGESQEALANGTAAVCCRAAALGASVLRVHDVAVIRRAIEETFWQKPSRRE